MVAGKIEINETSFLPLQGFASMTLVLLLVSQLNADLRHFQILECPLGFLIIKAGQIKK